MNPGTVLDDRFELERAVAEGGMGAVWLATDRSTGERVAIKVVRDPSDDLFERFAREIDVLREVDHAAIVRYVAHGSTGGEPWLAMEWLEGEDLGDRLARGALDVADTLDLARRVAGALAATHRRGIVHRDLKPSNVFLVGREASAAKLLDFGTARPIRPRRALTQTGMLVGTPFYMAPEQARGQRDLDARADVFALGCVVHECLAGAPPFGGVDLLAVLAKILLEPAPPLCGLRADVPRWLESLVLRMLAKEPSARPPDGEAVLAELEAADPDRRRPSAMPPSMLGRDEQRVFCIILAGHADAETATVAAGKQDSLGALLRVRLSGYSARVEILAGDAALVIVRGSQVATDQAMEAARAALAMRGVLGETPLVIATGRGAATGAIPVGEVVERASRMLAGAPAGAIVVDETTSELVAGRFVVEERGGARVLVGERGRPATIRTVLGRATPFVGRERELAQLEALVSEALEERAPRAALITAPAGVGKTRLSTELVARVVERAQRGGDAPLVLSARADAPQGGAPGALLGAALRERARLEGATGDEARARFAEAMGADLGDDAPEGAVFFLGEIARVHFPDSDSEALRAARRDPSLMGDRMREAWVALAGSLARARPTLLLLDDVQWADATSLSLIDAALGELEDAPLAVLAFGRAEIETTHPRLWSSRGVLHVRLHKLGRAAAERLAREILGEQMTTDTLARVVDRADGNAFFLEELLRAVAQGSSDVLPDTVLATVQARLDGLSAHARRALRMASIFGERFREAGVAHLLDVAPLAPTSKDAPKTSTVRIAGPGLDWASELTAAEVVERAKKVPGELAFRHALVRDAAYETLTPEDRAEGHRVAAEWLARDPDAEPSALAIHFEKGRDAVRARAAYLAAASRAILAHDLEQGRRSADKAIELGAEGEELGRAELARAVVACWTARPSDASTHGQAAAARLAPGSADWFRAAGEVLAASGRVNDPITLTAWIQRAREVAPEDDEAARARLVALCRALVPLGNMGHEATMRGLLAQLDEDHRRGVALDVLARAQLVEARGVAALSAGRPWDGIAPFQEARRLYREAHALRDEALAGVGAAWLLAQVGALDEAERELDAARATATKVRSEHALGWAIAVEAAIRGRRGDLPLARELYAEARSRYRRSKNARQEGWALVELSEIELARGDAGLAETLAREALEVVRHMVPLRVCALAAIARALVAQGRAEEAVTFAREAETVMTGLAGLPLGEASVHLALVESLLASGDVAEARAAAARAKARIAARAERIDDEERRRSFLGLAEHARTFALAAELEARV